MIIKSMSRKVPSFGQLIGYIDREDGHEVGAGDFQLRHNVMGRDQDRIREEFEANGALLRKRKNGVYLYHEILSITRAIGLEAEVQKERLMEIARPYVEARCPDNLVYGGLHEDKDHSFHMHLMISANRVGETGRMRLTKAQFREIQVQLERHVLQAYPELEQKVAIDKRSDRNRSKVEAELERRTGKRSKREEVLERVQSAFEASTDRQSLLDALGREGLELYVRGKNLGVVDHESGKRHRLKTLDLDMADRVALRMEAKEASNHLEEEAQRGDKTEKALDADQTSQAKVQEPEKETGRAKSEEYDMSDPVPPNKERRELIDKGHIEPDPSRDLLSMEEWKAQEKFYTKVQQSWRRTMDDFRGRTKDLEERAMGKEQKGRDEPE